MEQEKMIDQIVSFVEQHRESQASVAAVSYTHLDVYKRQVLILKS